MTEVLTLLAGVLVVARRSPSSRATSWPRSSPTWRSTARALGARAAAGDAAAQRALDVTRRTSFMLSGAQLGITVTGLLVGYVAEPLIGESLGAMLGGVGVPTGVGVGHRRGARPAVLHRSCRCSSASCSRRTSRSPGPSRSPCGWPRSTALYLRVFGWLIWVFDQASNLLLAGAADRAGPRRRARRHRPRPRAHRRGLPRERRPAGRAVDDARPHPRLPATATSSTR